MEMGKLLDDCFDRCVESIDWINVEKCKDFEGIFQHLQNFSKESLLDDLVVTQYMKDKFIQVFKALGFDYGNDYEKYVKDENLMDKIYNNNYKEERDNIVQEYQKERIKNNSLLMKGLNQLTNLDIKGGNKLFIDNLISYTYNTDEIKPSAYVMNYVDSNEQLKSVCVCPLGTKLSNELFIHELGHIVQSDIHYQDDNDLVVKMGFDLVLNHYSYKNFDMDKITFEHTNGEYKKRKWETGNEVLHDFLMNKLAYYARQKGLNIGMGEKEPLIYTWAFALVKDFIFENERFIRDCQVNEEFALNKVMGQQEYNTLFDTIDSLVYNMKNNYQKIEQEIGSVVDLNTNPSLFDIAYMDNEWSYETRKYLDCYIQADEIFGNFKQRNQELSV
jgi:hypothetical protein